MNHTIKPPVITFDGPAGTGKGTISQLLAEDLGWHYLDSGALFRILAYATLTNKIDINNANEISSLAKKLEIEFKNNSVLLFNKDISNEIRTEETSQAASLIAVFPKVRTILAEKQIAFRKSPGLIADGRDMGTIIFPDANIKFFLDATPQERAKRRHLQLKKSGIDVNLREILKDIKARDERDRNRSVAPLVPADDAILIDTTNKSIEEVYVIVKNSLATRKYSFNFK